MNRVLLTDMVTNFPDEKGKETAVIFLNNEGEENLHYSYFELAEQCQLIAQNLLKFPQHREVVLIALDDQGKFVPAFFGCLLAGKIPAPLPSVRVKKNRPGWGRVAELLSQDKNTSLLIEASQQEDISSRLMEAGLQSTALYTYEALTQPVAEALELPELAPGDVAYIQYTSGSTSKPKGVALTHEQVLDNMSRMYRVFNRGMLVRVAGWLPFYHDMGLVGHLFTALYEMGMGVFLPPASFLARPALWLSTISKYKANCAAAPTFSFEHCVRKIKTVEDWDLSSWKFAYVGSETVSLATLDKFTERFSSVGFSSNTFMPVYGLAEVTLLAAGGGLGLEDVRHRIIEKEIRSGLNRNLIPFQTDPAAEISIHDLETQSQLADGNEGEIWVNCSSNFAGYSSDVQKSGDSKPKLVKTGDLGFLKDGFLYISGRKKEVIIIRGVNYAAEDLELAARRNQTAIRLNDATACVTLQQESTEELIVFQEIQRHLDQEEQRKIAEGIRANLSDFFGLQSLVVLIPQGLMPRTDNYKIARVKCLEKYLNGDMRQLYSLGQIPIPKPSLIPADNPVVIVGMACRFPGYADSLEKYWELLENGVDAVREVPEDRWEKDLFYDEKPGVAGKMNTKWGGFIDRIDYFDPSLFGISAYEASEIDPQQRLLLETSWRLLEHSGWKKEKLTQSSTGVFIGISTNDYLSLKIKLNEGLSGFNAYSGLGISHSVAANRLSYFYDLKGPSMAIDTACSSSLTAFNLAVNAIKQGECEQAIVGGVNAILAPGSTVVLSQLNMMAPDGRCKTFDESADGYVRSEGCGLVMLKRKLDAERDGDNILATVVAGTSAQDGRSLGITHPNGAAQHELIRNTLAEAGLDGSEISYIEAHGTGTRSGDPTEWEQLRKVYGSQGEDQCYVGSVKASIGHLEASAGIASVIKGVLMLQKKRIPPQLHIDSVNPKIDLEHTRLKIATTSKDWIPPGDNALMAISSFGFGGSLAHLILGEGTPLRKEQVKKPEFLVYPLVLSASSADALQLQIDHWKNWLQLDTPISYPDLCQSQALHRSDLGVRTFFSAQNKAGLVRKLQESDASLFSTVSVRNPAKLCMLFTGLGEHYGHMGKALYYRFPLFKHYFDRCINSISYEDPDISLLHIAFESTNDNHGKDHYQQPIAFAVQYALGRFCMDLGIAPSTMLGYSFGEYVAACLAGCFSPEDGMRMLQKRAELIDAVQYSAAYMATIYCDHKRVAEVLDTEKGSIAVYHSPQKTVISGDAFEMKRVCDHFETEGVKYYELKTSHPYHSHLLEPAVELYTTFLKSITFQPPTLPWLSSVKGDWMTEAPTPEYWANQLVQPVHYAETTSKIDLSGGTTHFIEIGPGASSLMAINENLELKNSLLLRTLNKARNTRGEEFYLVEALGRLYSVGFNIDWANFFNHHSSPTQIPTYQFNQQLYRAAGLSAGDISRSLGADSGSAIHIGPPAKTNFSKNGLFHQNIHYKTEWIKGDSVYFDNSATSDKDYGWILIGGGSALQLELHKELKEAGQSVHSLSYNKRKLKKQGQVKLSDYPDKKDIHQNIDRIINYESRQEILNFKVIYLGVQEDAIVSTDQLNKEVKQSVGVLTALMQALYEQVKNIDLWLITQNAQAVNAEEYSRLSLSLAPLWGFGKTAFLEHPAWRGGMIDISKEVAVIDNVRNVIQKILSPKAERCVLLREEHQYIERIIATPKKEQEQVATDFRTDGAYIITGGLGGLGLKSAHWLAEKGIKHLVITSRRSLPDQSVWATITEDHERYNLIQELEILRQKLNRLDLVSSDIRDIDAIKGIFTNLKKEEIPIRGILHAAGVNWFSKILDLDREELLKTMEIKVGAAWALHELSKEEDLDCFIMYSSVSALWGSVDLSHYSAANYFLDMLALHRQQLGLPALSVDWGPWAEVGMSAGEREVAVLKQLGFNLMPPNQALKAMDSALSNQEALSLIADVDWNRFRPFVDFSLRPSLFADLMDDPSSAILSNSDGLATLFKMSAVEARAYIEKSVRAILRRVMLIESMEELDETHRFNFLGMDSLMAIAFVVELEQFFDIKLSNTLPYNYPHIKAVTDLIFNDVYEVNATEPTIDEEEITKPVVIEKQQEENPGEWYPIISDGYPDAPTLFCFPYAGSGVSVFHPLSQELPESLNVIGVQAPGREERANEKTINNTAEMVSTMLANFEPPTGDYYFFGHSLGGLLAYELYAALSQAGYKLPKRIIVSGASAPLNKPEPNFQKLSDEAMVATILENYDSDHDPALRKQAILSIKALIRSDLQLMESVTAHQYPVKIPLRVLAGLDDQVAPIDGVRDWIRLAENDFSIKYFTGGHDFIHEERASIANVLCEEVSLIQGLLSIEQ